MAAPYIPAPDPDSMAKVQHIWDWYFAVVEAKKLHVRSASHPTPAIPALIATTDTKDLMDYRMMKDLKLIDARSEGRAVWEITIPRYLCNLNGTLVFRAGRGLAGADRG